MRTHRIDSGGLELRVDDAGPTDGPPVLFVHGYTQSRLSWTKQFESALAEEYRLVAMDIRGHGESDKPPGEYGDASDWAGDVASVIDALDLDRPVLVGWSYAGNIVTDYVDHYGEDAIAGVNFVDALTRLGTEDAIAVVGEETMNLIPGLESTDAAESIEALSAFVDLLTNEELSPADRYFMLGYNAVTPPYVRKQMFDRQIDHDDVLASMESPVLVTHGENDPVILPEQGRHTASVVGHADESWYPDTGHSPFWEAPDRFNRELREFVTATRA
jgi:pimeloyl-ACP methyl ester carboxylesterase